MTEPAKQTLIVRFRPFRVKDGKVIVTAYSGWHKMECDVKYRNAMVELLCDLDTVIYTHVVNHEGKLLYWPTEATQEAAGYFGKFWYDCEGLPAFSHQTKQREGWEPLTTNIIVREFNALKERLNLRFAKLLN